MHNPLSGPRSNECAFRHTERHLYLGIFTNLAPAGSSLRVLATVHLLSCIHRRVFWAALLTLRLNCWRREQPLLFDRLRLAEDEECSCAYAAACPPINDTARQRPKTDTRQRGPGRQGAIAISKEWVDQGTTDTYSCLVEEVEKDLPLALLLTILTMTRG